MTVKNVADGTLVFPAELTSDSATYVGSRWTMITDDTVVTYRSNGQRVFELLTMERTGKPIEEADRTKRATKSRFTVEVVDDRGEPMELSIRDTGACGCGNILKNVSTLAGAQAKYSQSVKREQADKEKAAKRADRRQEAQQRQRERNEQRAAARAANRTKRRKR